MGPAETTAFLNVYGRFWKFQAVLQGRNMLQLDVKRCHSVSVLSADTILTIINVKTLMKECDKT